MICITRRYIFLILEDWSDFQLGYKILNRCQVYSGLNILGEFLDLSSSMGVNDMEDLIRHIAFSLVDNPGMVKIDELKGSQSSIFELKVAKEDIGKVIGKQGKTAEAIRTIMNAVSAKSNRKMVLEIIE